MKIYLAGPMTDFPLLNFQEFFKAAIALRKQGHEVINPAEYDMAQGIDPSNPDGAPFTREEVLLKDFKEVLDADAICMLPGWKESSGARDEHHIALRTGRKVYIWNAYMEHMKESDKDVFSEIDLCQDDPCEAKRRLWESLPGVKSLRMSLTKSSDEDATVRVDVIDSETGEMLYDFGELNLENSNHQIVIKLDAEVELEEEVA